MALPPADPIVLSPEGRAALEGRERTLIKLSFRLRNE